MKTICFIAFLLFYALHLYLLFRFIPIKNKMYIGSALMALVFFGLLQLAIRLFHLIVPQPVLVLCLIVVSFHNLFGYHLGLYLKSQVFDRYLHAFGSFSFALLLYFILENLLLYGGSRLFLALYAMLLGIASGTVFEIYESLTDRKKGTHMQKGLKDTNVDQLFNMLGSAAAGVIAYFVILT